MTNITLINEVPNLLSTGDLGRIRTAMETYANLVAVAWTLSAVTVVVSDTPIAGNYNFYITNRIKMGTGILGYHTKDVAENITGYINADRTLKRVGAPFGWILRAYPKLKIKERYISGSFSEVLSHEIAEALVDPLINLYKIDKVNKKSWLVEVGDQAYNSRFVIPVSSGPLNLVITRILCADFTLPSFYDNAGLAPYSYAKGVSAPFHLEKTCYASISDVPNG
jgi:hypothetical protein